MAMDIISKEKKDIRWKGLPSNAQHDLEGLERDKARLERNIKKKREQLEQVRMHALRRQGHAPRTTTFAWRRTAKPPASP